MDLPIGYDNFGALIENQLDFVDKSLFIKTLIDDKKTQAIIINRPRRFGKTLNLSMLHHFLASEVNGVATQRLFDGLKIMQAGEQYLQHQGAYPVIFMTFKSIKFTDSVLAQEALFGLVTKVYKDHRYLLSSAKIQEEDKKAFVRIIDGNIDSEVIFANSLKNLTEYLYQHHGVKPWILLDEYDAPIQTAFLSGKNHFEKVMQLIRLLFGEALKTNPFYYKAVITGILHIAKEDLFSGVNNLEVYSVLKPQYAEYFGFTETEVTDVLQKSKLVDRSAEVKDWYNGYQIGDVILYNPWSIANYIKHRRVAPYWVNTSDNQLIKILLLKSTATFKLQLEKLLNGEAIEVLIDATTVIANLDRRLNAVWGLFLMTGYLKEISQTDTDQGLLCALAIPNREVRIVTGIA